MFTQISKQQFEMNGTIEILMYPKKFIDQKITKKDIQEAAKYLMHQIEQHPSFKVQDVIKDAIGPEEKTITYQARLKIQDAFTGGLSASSDMLLAYKELIFIYRDLRQICEKFHIFISIKKLGGNLVSLFKRLIYIDERFKREEMIEDFMKRLHMSSQSVAEPPRQSQAPTHQ